MSEYYRLGTFKDLKQGDKFVRVENAASVLMEETAVYVHEGEGFIGIMTKEGQSYRFDDSSSVLLYVSQDELYKASLTDDEVAEQYPSDEDDGAKSVFCPAYMLEEGDAFYLPDGHNDGKVKTVNGIGVQSQLSFVSSHCGTTGKEHTYTIGHDERVEIPLTISNQEYTGDWRWVAAKQGHMADVLELHEY